MLRLGPWLVIRGMVVGCLVVIAFTSYLGIGAAAGGNEIVRAEAPAAVVEEITPAAQVVVDTGGCRVSSRYPDRVRRWCDVIQKYADKFGLHPDLVAALIWQESGGDPQAYSRSGAVGLMQIMARDGKSSEFMCPNGPCFAKRPSIEQLNDPEFNIKYGTRMLAGLSSRLGSLRDALKAYGPMNVGYSYADKVLSIFENYRE